MKQGVLLAGILALLVFGFGEKAADMPEEVLYITNAVEVENVLWVKEDLSIRPADPFTEIGIEEGEEVKWLEELALPLETLPEELVFYLRREAEVQPETSETDFGTEAQPETSETDFSTEAESEEESGLGEEVGYEEIRITKQVRVDVEPPEVFIERTSSEFYGAVLRVKEEYLLEDTLKARLQVTNVEGEVLFEEEKASCDWQYDEESFTWQTTVNCEVQGRYEWTIEGWDIAGNQLDISVLPPEEIRFFIDLEAPDQLEVQVLNEGLQLEGAAVWSRVYPEAVTVKVSAHDLSSGVETFIFDFEGREETGFVTWEEEAACGYTGQGVYEAVLTLPVNQIGMLQVKATDKAGLESEKVQVYCCSDTIVPAAPEAEVGDYEPGLWTKEDVKITIKPKDSISGIGRLEYTSSLGELTGEETWYPVEPAEKREESVDNWQAVSLTGGNIILSEDSNAYYYFRGVSNAGVTGEISPGCQIRIQKTKPENTTAELELPNDRGWYTWYPKVYIHAPETEEDDIPVYACYELAGEELAGEVLIVRGKERFTQPEIPDDGKYTLRIWTEDEAGNRSEESKDMIKTLWVDTRKPELTLEYFTEAAGEEGFFRGPRSAVLWVTDSHFDGEAMEETFGSLSGFRYENGSYRTMVTFEEEGEYTPVFHVWDEAGNEASLEEPSFILDITPPELWVGGVERFQAYSDSVTPEIRAEDAYLAPDSLTSTLFRNGRQIPYQGGPVTEDGVYVLRAGIADRAGNRAEAITSFSVNKKGSAFFVMETSGTELPDIKIENMDQARVLSVLVNGCPVSYTFAEGRLHLAPDKPLCGKCRITVSVTDSAGNQSHMEPLEIFLP